MKKYLLIILVGIVLINFTGCYTQLEIQNEHEVEEQPVYPAPIPEPDPPCLCTSPDPLPPPLPDPIPIYDPIEVPTKERVYKTRNTQIDESRNSGDGKSIRNTGGRNPSERQGRR